MTSANQMRQMNHGQMSGNPRSCSCISKPASSSVSADSMNRMQLLNYIDEVSFAVDDMLLYLDTHPFDTDALSYHREMVSRRRAALDIFARRFGPLTIDTTNEISGNSWEWVMQPWPWEPMQKGGCR